MNAQLVQRMVHERVQKQLPIQVRERDYERASTSIRTLIDTHGWRNTLRELRIIAKESSFIASRVRDALFHTFELQHVTGVELDLLAELATIDGNSSADVREKVHEKVINVLKNQVSKGNTFFLEVESLHTVPLVRIVPEILEARAQEFRTLPDNPHLNQVLSTYYGFTILTTTIDLEKGKNVVEDLGLTYDRNLSVRGKRFTLRESLWDHCDPQTQHLLLNIARLHFSKTEGALISAATALGETGDSRAWSTLTESKKRSTDYYVLQAIDTALAKIGAHLVD